ncbi:MAG: hypothetical protein COV55_00930 [Candidatus Komeilibacteria bacterium CG11_big_fil_rev_8_21_14_0_20_36_20]|uniref:Glycosyltransferase 2-like domain-containing protein n=1 Tax=Candidatus Komeilibacteria bacterium CG11_big_fil_rev_8_21_14_0_20_36_20 TaxID=1974477 RepID=A0A2H0NDJ3_9BACT|nr:MAG: hypothetical protein COV55_00930 [Candidatus Komeilibacteria bacterium CG11_big_fil_rev_8_21_14_0_20_36_20]PIR81344.1 MAG: hypothetical protein COU21_03900 [Candidatus Komeilibacteria bacterium CG10_big_fil_rev_8_21_14_0_10_36_65]PJC54974.1 MAG: hypothetical protein CO027_04570 [Candidatus Komeilibacteria bacterium CG_4_9_14_0_2_um_filter_36_13]
MEDELLDLSVVVCSYNCEEIIEGCLSSVKENNPKEIILVDAGSTDKTTEIARPFVDKIVNDSRKGLGNARNIGLDAAECKYIVFVGADNIMPQGSLIKMIEYLEKYKCAIVSAITMLSETDSYLGWAQNIYREKYKPGYKNVVGTPTLFLREVLKKYRYDTFMTNSDDTDLCTRMAKDGHKFAISEAICYEKGFASIGAIIDRWIRYGRGDCLFYKKYAKNWSISRKLKSYCHPFMTDFITPFKSSGFVKDIAILPFLILITYLRYYSWLKTALFFKKRKLTSR